VYEQLYTNNDLQKSITQQLDTIVLLWNIMRILCVMWWCDGLVIKNLQAGNLAVPLH